MPGDRRKSVERHLSPDELDAAIDDAQEAGKPRRVRRLCLIRNLYEGDSLQEAGRRVGVSRPTAGRWADRWNEAGIGGLDPDFGGGRPPKLTDEQQEKLKSVLEADQPWTKREVKTLIEEAFDVTYSDRHVHRLLNNFGMNFAKPRPQAPERPDDAEDRLSERLQAAIDDLRDEEPVPDGGFVVGFLDEAWPQPTEHRQRLWAFGPPTISKQTPTASTDQPTLGFYALNGECVATCKPNVTKESVGEFFRADPREES